MRPCVTSSLITIAIGLTAAPASGICPNNMVQSGSTCIDRYEASIYKSSDPRCLRHCGSPRKQAGARTHKSAFLGTRCGQGSAREQLRASPEPRASMNHDRISHYLTNCAPRQWVQRKRRLDVSVCPRLGVTFFPAREAQTGKGGRRPRFQGPYWTSGGPEFGPGVTRGHTLRMIRPTPGFRDV